MWGGFVLSVLVGVLFLYIPGFLVLRAFRFSSLVSLVAAPILSLSAYVVICIAYEKMGVSASWISVAGPLLLILAAGCGVSYFASGRKAGVFSLGLSGRCSLSKREACRWRSNWVGLGLYVLAGVIVSAVLFAYFLGQPHSFVQEYDNVHHLGQIHAFIESGNWSPLTCSLFSAGDESINPLPGTGFYPAAWHILASLLVSLVGVPITLAANAVNFVFVAIVFPASMYVLMRVLFPYRPGVVACGALCSLAFSAFPWMLLSFGPLYPNAASFCIFPLLVVSFMGIVAEGVKRSDRVAALGLFLVGLFCCAFTQPNAVFSAGVFLIPFCIWRAVRAVDLIPQAKKRPVLMRVVFGVVMFLLLALVWYVLYRLPFLQSAVNHSWPAVASKPGAFFHALTLGFRAQGVQAVLAVLVVLGALSTLKHREHLWLACSYAFSALLYVVGTSSDGPLQHLLVGFWYTDTYRVAAMTAIFGIPLASMGLCLVARGVQTFATRALPNTNEQTALKVGAGIVALVFVLANYAPTFVALAQGSSFDALGAVVRTLRNHHATQGPAVYDADERAFVEEVKQIVPEGALVLNEPNDGSAFASSVDDLRVYYRNLRTYGDDDETPESKLIRTKLKDLATNDRVQDAVKSVGGEYLLVLDQGERIDTRIYLFTYEDGRDWVGVESVGDDTPGFDLLLSRGDMRLYKLDIAS